MKYISVTEFAKMHNIPERTVRHFCETGKIEGANLVGRTWSIPSDALRPSRRSRKRKVSPLLQTLREQQRMRAKDGIYHRTQIDFTYNSNHLEGSCLTYEQTQSIFETNTIGVDDKHILVDDIIETLNHFRCIDLIIKRAQETLNEDMIGELYSLLMMGTSDRSKKRFVAGEYKRLPKELGGSQTIATERIRDEMRALLRAYNSEKSKSFEEILHLHQKFASFHPSLYGNGRICRLVTFKECLANGLVPFIITEELKDLYDRGLREWNSSHSCLLDTCLVAQDNYKALLYYFNIKY